MSYNDILETYLNFDRMLDNDDMIKKKYTGFRDSSYISESAGSLSDPEDHDSDSMDYIDGLLDFIKDNKNFKLMSKELKNIMGKEGAKKLIEQLESIRNEL